MTLILFHLALVRCQLQNIVNRKFHEKQNAEYRIFLYRMDREGYLLARVYLNINPVERSII